MTMVLRPDQSVDSLVARGNASCPRCQGELRRWGWSRWRAVRGRVGEWRHRPPRVRCRSCGVTHVVLPPEVLVRRRDEVAIVGAAWERYVAGYGVRPTAEALGLPLETVRGWLRRLRQLARAATSGHPGASERSNLQRALALLAASARDEGWNAEADLWRFAAFRSQGTLLLRNASWPFEAVAEPPMG